jgi:hypothetical protein
MDDAVKLFIGGWVVLFFGFGYLFRKKISYIWCPLQKYTGKINNGKAYYIMMPHLMGSFAICILFFSFLSDIKTINTLFENSVIRTSSFLLLWFICLFFTGLLIEKFLKKTDREYFEWKQKNGPGKFERE